MNTKTMEGLVGAGTNMNLINTPMRVYREAERKGNTAVMERAMGYVGEFGNKAEAYKAKAEEGLKEDAEAAREKAKSEQEKAIEKRREERTQLKERMEENRRTSADAGVAAGGEKDREGKVSINVTGGSSDGTDSGETEKSTVKEPVLYTKTGEVSRAEQPSDISISI